MKKLLKTIILTAAMSVLFTSCFAATEADLLTYLKSTHEVAGESLTLNKTQVTKLENFLNKNEISDTNVDIIIAKANEVKSYMNKAGVSDPLKLNAAQKQNVMNLVQDAGTAAGVQVSFNKTTNEMVVTENGTVLENISFTNKVPFTGTSAMPYAYVAVGIILVSAITIITIKRNSKLSEAKN